MDSPEIRQTVAAEVVQGGKRKETVRTVPLLEERLHVDKVPKDRGGYRITKRVETREELIDEPLRHHKVEIERCPVGRRLLGEAMPEPRYEGDTYIVPVIEEVLVTEKQLVLVEEIRITRRQGMHHKPQQVTLRKEDISIERLEPEDSSTTPKF